MKTSVVATMEEEEDAAVLFVVSCDGSAMEE